MSKKPHQRSLLTPAGRAKTLKLPKLGKLGHGSIIVHEGKVYEVIYASALDVQRFPAEWPKPGWYFRHGAPGTTLLSKSLGPYATAAKAGQAALAQT